MTTNAWIRLVSRTRLLVGLAALLIIAAIIFYVDAPPAESISPISQMTEEQWRSNAKYGPMPNIIHQAFPTSKVFIGYRPHIENCLKLNPGWKYFLWTNEDILALINEHYPFFMSNYHLSNTRSQRHEDVGIRYMALHHFGGIFIDMDFECVKPFFPSLANRTAFIAQEPVEHANIFYGRDFSAMNSAMGSAPRHPFFMRLIFAMMTDQDTSASTGSDLLNHQLQQWWSDKSTRRHEVTLLRPQIISSETDERLDRLRNRCTQLKLSEPKPGDSNSQQLLSSQLQLCDQYRKRDWKPDISSSQETVGRLLFKHLEPKKETNYFDIREIAQDAMFYSRNKSSMTGLLKDHIVN